MKVNVFFFSILASLLVNVPTYADELERFIDSKPYKEMNQKNDTQLSPLKHTWTVPEGTYGSLFKSDRSIRQIHDWLTTKSTQFIQKEKSDTEKNDTYLLQQSYAIDGHSPLKVEIYVPHPRVLDDARYGLLEAYRKLTPKAMNVDFHEKTKVQNYDAVLYVVKDKSCRILINMPHEIRVYLIGQCDDLDTVYKLGDELSLPRLETKLEN